MTKIISFSLWGDNPNYIIGAIKNAILAKQIYHGWVCRFYIDNVAIQNPNITYIKLLDNTEIVDYDFAGDWTFNINRFRPIYEDNTEYFISRDCDSRLSFREARAVDEWINSGKTFHIMRDHPFQFNYPILAGMFGSRRIEIDRNIFDDDIDQGHYSDQIFLYKYIYPLTQNNCLIHDGTHRNTGKKFPQNRQGSSFIGDSFDLLDNRHPEYHKYVLG